MLARKQGTGRPPGPLTVKFTQAATVIMDDTHQIPVSPSHSRSKTQVQTLRLSSSVQRARAGHGNPLQYSCLETPMDLGGYGPQCGKELERE